MKGNIIGEPFDDFVLDQISIRQQLQGSGINGTLRTNPQLQYLTNKNAWVKLASPVSILDNIRLSKIGLDNFTEYSGTQLAKKAVLFNTLSSLTTSPSSSYESRAGVSNTLDVWNNNFSYGLGGNEYGLAPSPGIQEVQIQAVNRGSIRKATVTLKAYNKFQFELIELLYLRLGFTMMLEWGWDKYLDEEGNIQTTQTTLIEDKWFKANGISQLEMLKSIETYRRKYKGNYDGFFGKVVNFSWNFNPDGTYNITLDLNTLGDVIESIKVNVADSALINLNNSSENNNTVNLPNSDDPIYAKLKDTPIVKNATLNNIGFYLYEKIGQTEWKNLPLNSNYFSIKDSFTNTTTKAFSNAGTGSPGSYNSILDNYPWDNAQDPYNYFLTLKELLVLLKENIIPSIINGDNNPTLQLDIETSENSNRANYYPNQTSLDPRICMINPGELSGYNIKEGINHPPYIKKLKKYTTEIEGVTYGKIMNIYLNFNFVSQLLSSTTMDSKLSLYKFLEKICDGINNALGGVNKLEPIIKDDYFITIIDQSYSFEPPKKEKNIPNIEVFGYNLEDNASNFVKNLKFQTKITPQIASQISIGATANGTSTKYIEGTAFSKWNEGLQDRFNKEYKDPIPPEAIGEINQEILVAKYQKIFENYQTTKVITQNREIKYNIFSQYFSRVDNFIYNLFGVNQNLDPVRDFKNVNYYGIVVGEMNFNEFLEKAIEADRIRKFKKVLTREELSYKEYSIWLAKSFGGTATDIKILEENGEEKSFKVSNYFTEYIKFNKEWVSQGKIAYKNYINRLINQRYEETKTPSSTIGFLPLEFSLSLEGISGVKIYNKINIKSEFLPYNYPNSLKFLISQVNHRISGNDWETQLNTISIPNSKPFSKK